LTQFLVLLSMVAALSLGLSVPGAADSAAGAGVAPFCFFGGLLLRTGAMAQAIATTTTIDFFINSVAI